MISNIPINPKLSNKSLEELATLYHERMQHNYMTLPNMTFNYPNTEEGDTLKIAHEIVRQILQQTQ